MARKIQKLNSMPDYQARMPKYGHDISRSWTFGIAPGMISPVYGHPVMSGSHLKGQHKVFARFNPILKPFLGAIDIHVDTFFVPISMLYTPSLSLFYQTDDLISSSIDRNSLVKDRFPLIDIDSSIDSYISAYCLSGSNINYDQPQGVHGSNPPVSALNGVFECAPKSSIRFLDFMRLSSAQWFRSSYSATTQFHNPNIFPWYPLVYQCVYQNWDKYRNTDREQKSYAYNLDYLYDRSTPYDGSELVDDLFTMRYADQYKDYFTSIKVSPIGSSVSMLGSGVTSWDLLSRVNSYLSSNVISRSRQDGISSNDDQSSVTVHSVNINSQNVNLSLSSANIRQLFMVDKLLRVTGRAEKNYESQFLAHFGVKIPHDYQHNITHLAHSVGTLTAEPVISSSDTYNGQSGSSLGEVGGQGSVLFKGQEFSFDVPCHGFIITNIVFMPRYRYIMGIDRLYDLSSPDKWWQPELDQIGMQPLFEYETESETYGISSPSVMTRRLGWQFGYEHLKRKPSGLSVHFFSPGSGTVQNLFAPWVLSARPFYHRDSQNNFIFADPAFYWSFKVPPTALNGVSEVMYNSLIGTVPTSALSNLWDTRHTIFQSDPFIVDFTQDLSDLNFMSEYSEPELG